MLKPVVQPDQKNRRTRVNQHRRQQQHRKAVESFPLQQEDAQQKDKKDKARKTRHRQDIPVEKKENHGKLKHHQNDAETSCSLDDGFSVDIHDVFSSPISASKDAGLNADEVNSLLLIIAATINIVKMKNKIACFLHNL